MGIGNAFDALEFEDFLVYALDSADVVTLPSKCSDGSTSGGCCLALNSYFIMD
jgi:hypothetical protein